MGTYIDEHKMFYSLKEMIQNRPTAKIRVEEVLNGKKLIWGFLKWRTSEISSLHLIAGRCGNRDLIQRQTDLKYEILFTVVKRNSKRSTHSILTKPESFGKLLQKKVGKKLCKVNNHVTKEICWKKIY